MCASKVRSHCGAEVVVYPFTIHPCLVLCKSASLRPNHVKLSTSGSTVMLGQYAAGHIAITGGALSTKICVPAVRVVPETVSSRTPSRAPCYLSISLFFHHWVDTECCMGNSFIYSPRHFTRNRPGRRILRFRFRVELRLF